MPELTLTGGEICPTCHSLANFCPCKHQPGHFWLNGLLGGGLVRAYELRIEAERERAARTPFATVAVVKPSPTRPAAVPQAAKQKPPPPVKLPPVVHSVPTPKVVEW